MTKYLVGLQTIQTGATKQGDQVVKFQMGSHLIRKGNAEERREVEKKKIDRLDPNAEKDTGENFGGNTMSLMVAGVMETSIPLSDFLDSIWIQNTLIAYHSPDSTNEDEVFAGAFEISTPKPGTPAINLLLYYLKSEQEKVDKLAAAMESKILPGMLGTVQEGIAMAGQILPTERVKRRVTAEREYLYGKNDYWGAFQVKIRFPRSVDFRGYEDGGACLGIHLDDMSALNFERVVKLVTEYRTLGMHEAERTVLHEKVYENQLALEQFRDSLADPADRILHDIVDDVIAILNVQTIYDRKLARSRDFWKKIKGK